MELKKGEVGQKWHLI